MSVRVDEQAATAAADDLARAADIGRALAGTGRGEPIGMQLHRVRAPTPLVYTRFDPCLSFVLHGRKRALVGDDDRTWGAGSFLITPVDLPVVAQVVATGPEGDFVSGNWRLDPLLVADVLARAPRRRTVPPPPRLGTVTPEVTGALLRLLRLLTTPEEIPVLGEGLARELVFRLLQTDQAARLKALVAPIRTGVVTDAVAALRADLAHGWTLERIAAAAGTSPATLNRRFRELTSLSPMAYLRQLRLGEARRLLVTTDLGVAQVASRVGYRNASHFARDYRATYAVSPVEDVSAVGRPVREVRW